MTTRCKNLSTKPGGWEKIEVAGQRPESHGSFVTTELSFIDSQCEKLDRELSKHINDLNDVILLS